MEQTHYGALGQAIGTGIPGGLAPARQSQPAPQANGQRHTVIDEQMMNIIETTKRLGSRVDAVVGRLAPVSRPLPPGVAAVAPDTPTTGVPLADSMLVTYLELARLCDRLEQQLNALEV